MHSITPSGCRNNPQCEVCGTPLDPGSRRLTCGPECCKTLRAKSNVVACGHCGILFSCKQSSLKKWKVVYCSRVCYGMAQRRQGYVIEADAREKVCKTCQTSKPFAEFNRRSASRDGLARVCKECDADRKKQDILQYPEKHREKRRQRHERNLEQNILNERLGTFRRKYGVSRELYDELFDQQQGRCAICQMEALSRHGPKGTLRIDHNHETGAIRALLCNCCNTALGMFHDDIALVRIAVDYLRRYDDETRLVD